MDILKMREELDSLLRGLERVADSLVMLKQLTEDLHKRVTALEEKEKK